MTPGHQQDARAIEQRAQATGGSGHAADLIAPLAADAERAKQVALRFTKDV
jgi:hypothetical protein